MFKLLGFLIVSLLLVQSVCAVDVQLDIDMTQNSAIYTYDFIFLENESLDSFSFEKPRDSKLLSALQGDRVIPVKIAGDFFILSPEYTNGESFKVVFESKDEFENSLEKNSFSTYVSLSFQASKFVFNFDVSSLDREILELFPREYSFLGKGMYSWEVVDPKQEMFFLVEFAEKVEEDLQEDQGNFGGLIYSLFIVAILLLFGLVFFLLGNFKGRLSSQKKEESNQKNNSENNSLENIEQSDVKKKEEKQEELDEEKNHKSKEELFEDYLEKYLTLNEKEVVKVVRDFEGLAQNDILNHLPSLTKSNLSKIITKLNGKKVLNRIRVGKINKIHLGEKLKFEDTHKLDESSE